MFTHEDDSILEIACRESAYLHNHGLFEASFAMDRLVRQREELLEALKLLHNEFKSQKDVRSNLSNTDYKSLNSLVERVITRVECS